MEKSTASKRILSPTATNIIDRNLQLQQIAKRTKCNSVENLPQASDTAVSMDASADWNDCAEWTDFDFPIEEPYNLDLAEWKRVRIVSLEQEGKCTVVVVEEKRSGARAKCRLQYPWNTLDLAINDTVSVKAARNAGDNVYEVTANDGMLVTNPDFLISGTTVLGALYCQRKGVLQEKFRGLDGDVTIMHVGTLVHEMFQHCLVEQTRNLEEVTRAGRALLDSSHMVNLLYNYKMDKQTAYAQMEPFFPKIADFMKQHIVKPKPKQPITHATDIKLYEIQDIEENIWCHQLGLKGKIDVTVQGICPGDSSIQLMPLELKTGRASFSSEHVGQLVLYEMMMNLVGHHVEKGILLYLREGKCKPIVGNRNMKRDLIMLRNEIGRYLVESLPDGNSESFRLEAAVPRLPEPINNKQSCRNCAYNTVCVTYLRMEDRNLPADHGLRLIADEVLGHLSNAHIDYFIRWTGLIFLEDDETRQSNQQKFIWTMPPEERQSRGKAMINLTLGETVQQVENEFYHTFWLDATCMDGGTAPDVCLEVGDFLICSTNRRISVAAGRLISITKRELVVSLERNLRTHYAKDTFHLDKYESFASSAFNLNNLAMLLSNTEHSESLRRIIIDREQPMFPKSVPQEVVDAAEGILKSLNPHQRVAVLTAVCMRRYCLLKGLPGTGKTQTIVALIRVLAALGKTVLITSNTHSAVDNVLKRLREHDVKFIRLGSAARVDKALQDFTESQLGANCTTPDELTQMYDQYKIVGSTCLGTSHSLISRSKFDYCIVDEATQVFQSSSIRPLLYSDKFVLVGDPEQLPPVIKTKRARDLGADESLFHRLDMEGACSVLPTQYRMNKVITKLANDFAYNGKLVCGNETVARATLTLPETAQLKQQYGLEKWLLRAVSPQLELSVVLIDTQSNDDRLSARKRYDNHGEAAVVMYLILALLKAGVKANSIGVIAPFRAQVDLLRQYVEQLKVTYTQQYGCLPGEIEVNTVDQYQGKDKDLIIYSCTRTVAPGTTEADTELSASNYEILEDRRRLTVAITRAKQKLIIIGDTQSLQRYSPFRGLFTMINSVGRITLQDHTNGFDWQTMLATLDKLCDAVE